MITTRPDKEPRHIFEELSSIHLGIHLVLSTLIGLGIGYWLDGKFGTRPWLMVVGTFVGAAGGFLEIIRVLQVEEEKSKKKKEES
ncbi:MAG: AtpZ/AtpI family protein [Actinomycetota bacterium]|nr:AtpZ/AtpI family protein [Actinomycetota bacterium]